MLFLRHIMNRQIINGGEIKAILMTIIYDSYFDKAVNLSYACNNFCCLPIDSGKEFSRTKIAVSIIRFNGLFLDRHRMHLVTLERIQTL